jgi:hypothetical protein
MAETLLQQHASMRDDILQRIRRRCALASAGISVPGAGLLSCLGLPAGTFLMLCSCGLRDRREKRPYEDLVKSHTRLQQECKVSFVHGGYLARFAAALWPAKCSCLALLDRRAA